MHYNLRKAIQFAKWRDYTWFILKDGMYLRYRHRTRVATVMTEEQARTFWKGYMPEKDSLYGWPLGSPIRGRNITDGGAEKVGECFSEWWGEGYIYASGVMTVRYLYDHPFIDWARKHLPEALPTPPVYLRERVRAVLDADPSLADRHDENKIMSLVRTGDRMSVTFAILHWIREKPRREKRAAAERESQLKREARERSKRPMPLSADDILEAMLGEK